MEIGAATTKVGLGRGVVLSEVKDAADHASDRAGVDVCGTTVSDTFISSAIFLCGKGKGDKCGLAEYGRVGSEGI